MASRENADAAAPEEEKVEINRREAINLAWLASLGFFLLPFGGVTLLFAYPRFREGEFGGEFRLRSAELPDIGESPVANSEGKFWLTRTDEGIRAIYKVCTHLGCLYNWQEQENKFICPCHGSQFTYESTFIQGPAPRSLDLFTMRAVKNGEVLAETEEPNSPIPVFDDPEVEYIVATGEKIVGNPV